MRKGDETRQEILDRAVRIASRMGLNGLTIGSLADELDLSKSGLFAHFQSKEALQVQTLQFAAQLFVDRVIRVGLKSPRGEPRLRALFGRWLEWAEAGTTHSGCLFVSAATELDDRDGPVREELVRQQRDWLELIASLVTAAVKEGHFRSGLDAEQLAHDMHGVMLAYHHARRLLRDPRAEERARHAFDALLAAARAPRPTHAPKPHTR